MAPNKIGNIKNAKTTNSASLQSCYNSRNMVNSTIHPHERHEYESTEKRTFTRTRKPQEKKQIQDKKVNECRTLCEKWFK